ncbi:hypothetical protein O6H91_15G040700 [Diphasiastrum complanatum]|uniref:Uncharacterized protein n=2 Tax=Diphasiastrum complanatum TaxID=34168 RepID=A0ACC2BHR7_DIPCM|nr:hypothetical protein O6H91_15G039600 [Diphasiastrum complanatum]KAJ7529264.1 hypothetical protein O6H91_15G040700 [Diphasiastrum complanatum]
MAEGKMRALVCRKLGDPTLPLSHDSPLYIDPAYPRPKLSSPTHVRVRVKAVSVNYATPLQIEGKYQERPPLPFVPTGDFSGTVVEVGAQVKGLKVGDNVCGMAAQGAYADELVIEQSYLYLIPSGCDLVEAGGLLVAFGTSHLALVHRANLGSGQVLLVLGAAGGVGLAAVQIGKLLGAVVIGSARGQDKAELLRSSGADFVVDSSSGNFIQDVRAFLKSKNLKGVDVLYDPVGGKLFKDSMKLLNWGAQVLIIGFTSGGIPTIQANIALVKNLTFHGVYWGSYMNHPKRYILQESVEELLSLLAKGSIHVNVYRRFTLSEVNLAFSSIRERKVIGKVMVILDDTENTTDIQSKL